MDRWYGAIAGMLAILLLSTALLTIDLRVEHGPTLLTSISLFVQGASLATIVLTTLFKLQVDKLKDAFREALDDALADVPRNVVRILNDMQQRGIIPPNIVFGPTVLGDGDGEDEKPGDKSKMN